ncbi:hypothetical protein HAX54_009703, partial [Datura stramonium]|nr:hypothetical protein [Datura stramonium]
MSSMDITSAAPQHPLMDDLEDPLSFSILASTILTHPAPDFSTDVGGIDNSLVEGLDISEEVGVPDLSMPASTLSVHQHSSEVIAPSQAPAL